jgi:hypothetical protein
VRAKGQLARPLSMMMRFALLFLVRASARDVVSFDFGWKHRTGLHARAKPDDQPPEHPDPGAKPAEAQIDYKDDDWTEVQLPHDGLISQAHSAAACPLGCSGGSFIPRHVLWYRKAFKLPAAWAGSAIWLDFEGSFRLTTVWINDVQVAYHDCGYTPFRVRLDNLTGIHIGDMTNVISIFVDPDNGDEGAREHGSGWWYEGGGLYRHVSLVRADKVHVDQDGLFAYSNLSWSANGATSAVVHASVDITNAGSKNESVCVDFWMTHSDGVEAVSKVRTGTLPSISPTSSITASALLKVASPNIWSAAEPFLYTVGASIFRGNCSGNPIDVVEVSHGFRSLRYDPNDGFFLNKKHFKVRGFCDHNTFAVVGMAVPERISLFRAQASRAIGGNGRRTSHNPPDSAVLAIYDRVGIVVMDENRLFANETRYVTNMGVLVKRDRNHPSVVIWSFCNEAGCEGSHENGGPRFQEISYKYDGSRPTLANMFTFGDLLSNTIDVQGFSHQSRTKLEQCHAKLPNKPIFMSECCSCNTMRDEDEGCETTRDNPHNACTQKSFNARCAESNDATNASDGVDYAIGTMVWTLFDYYGEPPVGGLEVSSTYGQYDLCGFPKAAAFWYRTQWLLSIADGPDKTFPTNGAHEVHIVESWESPDSFPSTKGKKTRSIHAYSSAPSIELFVNGKSQGSKDVRPMIRGPGSYAEWTEVPWEAGTLQAIAHVAGKEVARDTRTTNGPPAALSLSIDAPSAATGTGSALLLDGQDAALLRASVVDKSGNVINQASNNISFRVISGPGRVQGTHNGDPHIHIANNLPSHPAYHGLVRAVIRVTSAAARPSRERDLLQLIDNHGPMSRDAKTGDEDSSIVVEASSVGFEAVRVSIPVSADSRSAGVMSVAQAAAGKAVNFFKDTGNVQPIDVVV